METHWLGIHDHPNIIEEWLRVDNQYTWLRTFENLECKTSAFLKTRDKKRKDLVKNIKVRSIEYYFDNNSCIDWSNQINQINPTHILWNICYYSEALPLIIKLKKQKSNIVHCIRIHHEVSYLSSQEGFLDFLFNVDFVITPTNSQLKFLKDLGYSQPMKVIPFGVDDEIFRKRISNKDIDFISCCNKHPLRNLKFLKLQYLILNLIGFKCINITGLSRLELSKYLRRSKIFFLTSLTEASGSRILLEAISSGCTPVVFEECFTAVEVLKDHNYGFRIKSKFKIKMPEKFVKYNIIDFLRILLNLFFIRFSYKKVKTPYILDKYLVKNEIEKLNKILKEI